MQFLSTQQPVWKRRLLKAANVSAQLAIIVNLSYLGVVFTPAANAQELPVETVTETTPVAAETEAGAAAVAEPAVATADPVANPALGQTCGLDIGLIVDRSGSMDSSETTQLRTAMKSFVMAFDGTPTEFSLATFSTNSSLNQDFARTPAQMNTDLNVVTGSGDGYTNWDSAMQRSMSSFENRPEKANLIVIATDGSPNRYGYPVANTPDTANWTLGLQNAIPTANTIKTGGTRIVVVGIGEDTTDPATPAEKLDKMKMISGTNVALTPAAITTSTDVIKVTDFAGIGDALAAYAKALCGGKILVQKHFDTNGDGVADVLTSNPLLSGYTFDVDGTPSNPAAQVTTNVGSLEFQVLNGTYSVAETNVAANTRLVSATCVKGQQTVGTLNLQTRTISGLTLTTDQTISCTFVNAYSKGSLKVTKVVSGGQALPHEFGFRLVGSNGSYTYPTQGQNFVTFADLQPGTYSVEENGPAGYTQTASTCNNVNVVAGQQASCSITNTRDTGTVKVNKCVDVNGDGKYDGDECVNKTGSDLGFKWGIDNEAINRGFGQTVTLETGAHSIKENSISGYHAVGWYYTNNTQQNCTNRQSDTLPANLTITKDQKTEITLCNARDTGGLTVIKAVDTDGDGDIDVTNDQTWTWDLDGGNQNYTMGSTRTVTTGQHQVSEDNKANYHNIAWVCVNSQTQAPIGNGIGTSLTVNVPTNGATCTFTNARDTGTIQGYKFNDLNGNGTWDQGEPGLQGWTIQLSTGASTLTDATGHYQFTLVPTGTYTVNEVQKNGWMSTTPNPVTNVTVVYNQSTTVNFGNFEKFDVRVCKKVDVNGDGNVSQDPFYTSGWDVMVNQTQKTTNQDGCITYSNLGPGAYTVAEASKAGWQQTYPVSGTYSFAGQSGLDREYVFGNRTLLPDLTITKTDNVDQALPGDTLTYVLSYKNVGEYTADAVVIEDTLPSYVTYVNGSASMVPVFNNGTTLKWNLGTLAAGATGQITFQVTIDSIMPVGTTTLTNAVVISTTTTESDTTNNDDTDTTDVIADFGVTLEKSGPATTEPGKEITYNLQWKLTGNAFVDSLVLKDTVPTNTTFVSASNGGTELNGTVTWTFINGPYLPGDTATVTMTVKVAEPLYDGTTIHNTAEVCALAGTVSYSIQNPSVVKHCDDDDTDTTVKADFEVQIDKTGPATAQAGESLTYTLNYLVTGNTPIDSVVITDVVPANTTFVSASNSGVYDAVTNTVTWDLGSKLPGDMGSVTMTVTINAVATGTIITNTGEICGEVVKAPSIVDIDPTVKCDDDTTTTEVIAPVLTLDKVVLNEPVFYNPGQTISYQVTITNMGTAVAKNLVLKDTLPAGLTFVGTNLSTKSFTLGDLAIGASTVVTYDVTIGADVSAGFYVNLAELTADNHGPLKDSETIEVRIPVVLAPEPKLTIEKTVDVTTFVNPGDTVTYTVVVSNIGDGTAVNVVLRDVLPDGFTFADTGTKTKLWTLGNIEPGQKVTVTYNVVVAQTTVAGLYDNLAIATGDNHDPVTDTVMVEVRLPQVLAATGISLRDYLLLAVGAIMIIIGSVLMRRRDEEQTA